MQSAHSTWGWVDGVPTRRACASADAPTWCVSGQADLIGLVSRLGDDASAEHLLDDRATDVAGLLDVLVVVAHGRVVGHRCRRSCVVAAPRPTPPPPTPPATSRRADAERAAANDSRTALAPRACLASAPAVTALAPEDPDESLGAIPCRRRASPGHRGCRSTGAGPGGAAEAGAAGAVAQSGAGPVGLPQPALSCSERDDIGLRPASTAADHPSPPRGRSRARVVAARAARIMTGAGITPRPTRAHREPPEPPASPDRLALVVTLRIG